MNRFVSLLTLTLAVQLMLVAVLFWPDSDPGENDARESLLSIAAADIDRVIISDSESSILLRREPSGWRLPDYYGLPVEEPRLNRLTMDLPGLRRGWPIASSEAAAARFEVAADNFQRRVQYYSGDTQVGELFIGTSPGFRKVHTRVGDGEAVYAVEYNTFDLPTESVQWLDKSLLRVTNIEVIAGLDYALSRNGADWSGQDGASPVQAEVDKLLGGLTSLRVTAAADPETARLLRDMEAPPTLTVQAGDAAYEYRLYEMEDTYYVQRSDIPVVFTLSAYDYDRLNDVTADSLYPDGAQQEEVDANDNQGNAG